MSHARNRDHRPGLHVLVVDDDLATLTEVHSRLTSEGHRVSVFSRAVGVQQVIVALQPDVVLIDVLMPDLNRSSLQALLARCRGPAPVVILHSRLAERTLRAVASIDGCAAVIQKTPSPLAFLLAFNSAIDRVRPSEGWPSLELVASGTHRIGAESTEDDTMNTGGARGGS